MNLRSLAVFATCLACACGGSTDDETGSGGAGGAGGNAAGGTAGAGGGSTCPDLSGRWTITEHCAAHFVGATVTLTQSGCSATDEDGVPVELEPDGTFTVMGTSPDGEPLDCTGTATTTKITERCKVGPGSCDIVLTK